MKRKIIKNKQTTRENKTQLKKSITILAAISIIGFCISLIFLGQKAINNKITGNIVGIEKENLYSIMFIILMLLIASIITLIYLRKK